MGRVLHDSDLCDRWADLDHLEDPIEHLQLGGEGLAADTPGSVENEEQVELPVKRTTY